jgi:RNA polymerase nonessential primary-like sigma factor
MSSTPEASPPPARRSATLLKFAHMSLSAALRFDYFSTGRGHQQSKAVVASKTTTKRARRAAESAAPLPDDDAALEDQATQAKLDELAGLAEPGEIVDSGWDQAIAQTEEGPGAAGADLTARYLAEVAGLDRLTSSEEYRLASLASEGDLAARQRLIEHHLGLVVMMAKRYGNRGLPLLDLIEEGNLGLITASAKFDPEMGYRFSTYAKWWIRQSIEMAVMTQSRLVRLPIHLTRSLKRSAKQQREAAREEGQSEHVALDADLVALLDDDDRDGGALIDELAAPDEGAPEASLAGDERRARLDEALAQLSDKERIVIEGRFGLRSPDPRTLEDIAGELRLSGERVRQIEKEALAKLHRVFHERGLEMESLF